jgi:hypothetical protein
VIGLGWVCWMFGGMGGFDFGPNGFLRDGVAGQILELLVIFVGSHLAGSWVFWCVVGIFFFFFFFFLSGCDARILQET